MAASRPGEVVMRRRVGLLSVGLVLVLLGAAADVRGPVDRTVGPPPAGASDEEAEEHQEAGEHEEAGEHHEAGGHEAGPAGSAQRFAAQRLYPFTGQPSLDAAYRTAVDQAATAGVWRSTDGGVTFRRSWPATLTPSIGALAVTPAGAVYAGTGEGNPGGGSVTFPGNGVFRSTDGGTTWTPAGLAGSDRIGRLALDPTNPNRLFAAATGSLFTPGGVRGLYRTTDGGTTWQRVLAGANGTTGAVDVAIDPNNPNRVFAVMWDHKREPRGRTDGGTTWTRVGGGLPASSTNLGRMGVAIARSNSARMYVIAADTTGNFLGFWTSTDSGGTWTRITNTSFLSASQSTYGWWFGRIWIDPNASRHLWVAGVQMLESSDAGASWTRNTTFHADQHAFAFDPRVGGRVFLGNDGGVYRSTAGGSLSGTWTKASSLAVNQFYTVAVSRQDMTRVSGGAQDNGSLRSWGGTAFNPIGGGDGTTNLIDPTNQNKVYACSQNGACTRSTDGGTTRSGFGATTSERRNWVTPVVFDPSNPAVMYYAGNRVIRSTNSAASFTVISPDLTRGDGGIGGSTWQDISAGLPDAPVNDVVLDPRNPAALYAGTDVGVFARAADGTWSAVGTGLPLVPVADLDAVASGTTTVLTAGTFGLGFYRTTVS